MEELARSDLQARLNELREKLEVFPSRKRMLMKSFNDELAFGEAAKAEVVRTELSKLEGEMEALSLEIRRCELALKSISNRGLV
jgi:hypothetical protein